MDRVTGVIKRVALGGTAPTKLPTPIDPSTRQVSDCDLVVVVSCVLCGAVWLRGRIDVWSTGGVFGVHVPATYKYNACMSTACMHTHINTSINACIRAYIRTCIHRDR